ncbi:aminodeoxychorismate synthase component I [Nioella nitratireducens]|uniref:aminodeoxychorismate synthase component I n=1 Tax=Nioella nitratireducens TaxID=1287720 RepID=UPI0008FD1B0A|nr:aminodeoxychorismate synthase component I [Nioella nitratireducens]
MRITFDHGPSGDREKFESPRRLIVADSPETVPDALVALDDARAQGMWLAGYASYELGYVLEPRLLHLLPEARRLPLLAFGVYDGPIPAQGAARMVVRPRDVSPRWSLGRYSDAFRELHELIGQGDLYQANLTFPIDMELPGYNAASLYEALMQGQAVGYGALVEQIEGPDILSRSPELFFRTTTDGVVQTRPMKGTQPRARTQAEDEARKAFLRTDEKNLAENLMIVDLLRNDISRVCEPGSVHVPELFTVESYATVHQMVSLIEGRLQPGVGLSAILAALHPCGSVTGAPKIRAMEVIRALEPWPREIYCGSIGWAAPDGRSEFNVAIRTLMRDKPGHALLNVGGGVVWDSTAQSEYEEALWKARFLSQFLPEPG